MSTVKKPKIFISYSHDDEDWMKLFEIALKSRFQEKFDVWHDRRIKLGVDWFDKIINSIHDTKIALLLVTDNFLTSSFIKKEEISRFRELAKEKQLMIVPVIISSCAWDEYSWLYSKQGFPKDNKPLDTFRLDYHNTFDKCQNIRKEINDLTKRINPNYAIETSPTAGRC